MKYRTIGQNPATRREVSVLSLGAMNFGTRTDEQTSFAILDAYVAAGGSFVDTSNNYAFWARGTQGGESEALLGRWRRSRGIGDEIVIATKLGGRPLSPSTTFGKNVEGLSAKVIRASSAASRERLGVEKLDLLYAHIEDDRVPLDETVTAFAELVAEGSVGLLGVSNHWAWRVERARALAAAAGLPGYEVLQYHHSYLRHRTDMPTLRSADGNIGVAGGDVLSYLRSDPGLALVAYSPLLGGGYSRPEQPSDPGFDHAGTPARWAALAAVAKETGATANQVVLAWLIGGEVPVIPLVGASSVAQVTESLAAVDLELTAEQRARLDEAH
ncbi:aldo/keto reductase [Kitasatospora sp. NBC_01302]|uniref:aldo/keto reductase n=1 Tax=Kitasatospora sp. NBC_01302 TaxID=2903575 RepID=UPI002E117E06|nr:aldo/keto reductase [Kitasatospora sp. NBC_01302]